MNRTTFLFICAILIPVLAWQSWQLFFSPTSRTATSSPARTPSISPTQSPLYSRLEGSQPGEVILIWPADSGTSNHVVIDLDKATFSEESMDSTSSNSTSASQVHPLTHEQIFRLKPLLKKLPAGQKFDQTPFATSQLHVAYFQGNMRLLRHYSIYRLPPEIVQVGEVLGLTFGETKPAVK